MESTLVQEATHCIRNHEDIQKALHGYARELGVPVEHVIVGALQLAAEVYNSATGNGAIPCLR